MKNILLIGGAGYIGTYLNKRLIADGYTPAICDIGVRGTAHVKVDYAESYEVLSQSTLAKFDVILWFAGHSNVPQSLADPDGAMYNNCIRLIEFAKRIPENTRFVYASTASLYSIQAGQPVHSSNEDDVIMPYNNAYDISKFAFDYLAKGFLKNYVGFRMGTLSGYSPNIRPELIFNSMNINAKRNGEVTVSNRGSFRSILFLKDLYQAVKACIELEQVPSGFYNLSSLNMTIGEIADKIGAFNRAKVKTVEGNPTYSFAMDTKKSEEILKIKYHRDLEKECAEFIEEAKDFINNK